MQEMWPDKTDVLGDPAHARVRRRWRSAALAATPTTAWPRFSLRDLRCCARVRDPDGTAAEDRDNVPYAPEEFCARRPTEWRPAISSSFWLSGVHHAVRAGESYTSYSDEVAVPQLVSDFGAKTS